MAGVAMQELAAVFRSKILFVGAHVDDIELFAGGTLSKYSEDAHCLIFSRHRGVFESPETEVHESMKIFGIDSTRYIAHDLMAVNGHFQVRREFIAECLRNARDTLNPVAVVTHPRNDTNQDHRQVIEEVIRVFKGHPVSILFGSFPHNEFPIGTKDLFVPVKSIDMDHKMMALQQYVSQHRNERRYFELAYWMPWFDAWGHHIGVNYAEAFEAGQVVLR